MNESSSQAINTLGPPSAVLNEQTKLPYDPFDEGHGDQVPEIKDAAGTVKRSVAPFAQAGYSNVYRGEWKPKGGTALVVAIKELRMTGANRDTPEAYEAYVHRIDRRLGKEMYVWRRLINPRITPLVGYIRSTRTMDPCLLSPYRANGNLRNYLLTHKDADRLALLQQAADGIRFLHKFDPKIAHGDIKPENILIGDEGMAEICDFGLAKALEDTRSVLTSSSSLGFGTMPYISPEGLAGKVDAKSTAADIYSFAGVMLEVLSGRAPFYGFSTFTAVVEIGKGEKPKRSRHQIEGSADAVMQLWELMNQCWSFAPVERPDMDQVIKVLAGARNQVKEEVAAMR